jgi:hypothetical protein
MTKLIIGGTGIVETELAHLLVERGEDVVIFHSTRTPGAARRRRYVPAD